MCNCSHGPVSSMPGSVHRVPSGQTCDRHSDRLAIFRIQGETDSFGCEYVDMCDECRDEYLAAKEQPNPGQCGICGNHVEDRKPMRDYDEGMSGPVYDACAHCRAEANARAQAELEEMQAEYPLLEGNDWDDWDDDLPINRDADDNVSLVIEQAI